MGTRRKSRELALQMLFQADMGKQTPQNVRQTFWNERDTVGKDVQVSPTIFSAWPLIGPKKLTNSSNSTPSTGVWSAWRPWIETSCAPRSLNYWPILTRTAPS